jgi:hypothetical protein
MRWHAERFCNLANIYDGNISRTPLSLAHIASVHSCAQRQLLLRLAQREAELAESVSEEPLGSLIACF